MRLLLSAPQSLLGTYLYVPVEVSEDYPGEKHTKPQNVKVIRARFAGTPHGNIGVMGTVYCAVEILTSLQRPKALAFREPQQRKKDAESERINLRNPATASIRSNDKDMWEEPDMETVISKYVC